MNICIDVGNSTIGIGAFKENKLVERMVVNTDPNFTEEQFYQLFKRPFNFAGVYYTHIIYKTIHRIVPPLLKNPAESD